MLVSFPATDYFGCELERGKHARSVAAARFASSDLHPAQPGANAVSRSACNSLGCEVLAAESCKPIAVQDSGSILRCWPVRRPTSPHSHDTLVVTSTDEHHLLHVKLSCKVVRARSLKSQVTTCRDTVHTAVHSVRQISIMFVDATRVLTETSFKSTSSVMRRQNMPALRKALGNCPRSRVCTRHLSPCHHILAELSESTAPCVPAHLHVMKLRSC